MMIMTVLELIMLTMKSRKSCVKLKLLQSFTFTWKILRDAVIAKAVLLDRKLSCDTACNLCHRETEIMVYLFVFYTFSRAIWFGSD